MQLASAGALETALSVHVDGQLTFNNLALRIEAALTGYGLAYLPEDRVRAHIAEGRLVRVLADWARHMPGITSTTRAADTPRPPSPPSSKLCVIESDRRAVVLAPSGGIKQTNVC